MMKLLLTSSGISNPSIRGALIGLLGKPIAESNALFIPTGIYPFAVGAGMAYKAICGKVPTPLCELGWKSLGVLELTALPSIAKDVWVSSLEQSDALLVWGGDPLYLSYWMSQSGLAEFLPSLQNLVYVGVSAGSMIAAPIFAETYHRPYKGTGTPLTLEEMTFAASEGEVRMNFITAKGAGFADFAILPHANHEDRPDASFVSAEKWAAKLPVPMYVIDDQTAIRVEGGAVEVVSEGQWNAFK
ncbi:Type 1 glutamine amidotransferase-like domain-containing protein [Edaphobacter albus]|uniref:Type 1 glutamine amidotransferase-like domain-containing protein n=1 Tax=Edaphobacter sp. 4G125 TaxID=2763071 RepID=UPI001C9900FA|nr:Type 1 glutamine amidotransferase-like domain-containing protein [Edaphobacter sp. 4G125]